MCIINWKNILFKGFTRGEGPLGAPSREAKFKQDAKPRSVCFVRTEWVDQLGRNMYVHTCVYTYVCIYIHAYMHTYTHIHQCMHTYKHTYIHTCVCMYIHTYVYTYIYVCMYYTYIHIHMYMCVSMCVYRQCIVNAYTYICTCV